MALTNEEAEQAYRFLANVLVELKLGWVVAQVEEKIALGKLRTEKIRARETRDYDSDMPLFVDSPRGPPASKIAFFTVAEDYTAQERLLILIDSVILAVPQLRLVAAHTISNLRAFGGTDELLFEPEANVREPFALRMQEVEDKAAASQRLLALLAELRGDDANADQTVTPH